MHLSRPNGSDQPFSVFFFDKIIVFTTLFIHIVAFFDLDTGIDDRYQMDVLFGKLLGKGGQIGKTVVIYREILIAFHIINVHIDGVKRDACLMVVLIDLPDVRLRLISPTALAEAKRPLGGQIAVPGEPPELLHHFDRCFGSNPVAIGSSGSGLDLQDIGFGITDIEGYGSRVIDKDAFCLISSGRQQDDEVLGSIEGALVLIVVRLIGIVADIDPASLVDATHRFAKTDDRKGGREGFGQSAFLLVCFPFREMVGGRDFALIQYNCACGNGRAHSKSFDHLFTSFVVFLIRRVPHGTRGGSIRNPRGPLEIRGILPRYFLMGGVS